jgi:UDP-N-acetylmuramyl pentapeptide phosphotransferase/UDP-N-acetylglucosamine-1-phosphate transferase
MENIAIILNFILYFFTGKIFLKTVLNLSKKNNFTKKNYRGDLIPKSSGIVLLLNIISGAIFYFILYPRIYYTSLISLILVGIVGLLDDIFGDETKGFKNHFRKLFKGEITTGFLKATFIFLISTFVVISGSPQVKITSLLDILIITLFSNFFNLLDLRPSRAIKVYLIFIIILAKNFRVFSELIPLISAVIVIIPSDFKGRAMLGDTGSNILGFSIGLLTVQVCNDFSKIIILFFLILFHLFCEKYSLTEVIDKNKFLRYIDKLGT